MAAVMDAFSRVRDGSCARGCDTRAVTAGNEDRVVINPPELEARPMLFVDCPLCERPAPFDTERDALDCDACGAHLEIAADAHVELPLAA
jgi:hypothetical protein